MCRFTKFAPATITRFCLRSTLRTTPVTPLPPPVITRTVSPVSTFQCFIGGMGARFTARIAAFRTHGLRARRGADIPRANA
jgi:hypothetical protein